MTTQGISLLYNVEDLRRVFELAYRVSVRLATGEDARPEAVEQAWEQYQARFEQAGGLTDSEVRFRVNELLAGAEQAYRDVYLIQFKGVKPNQLVGPADEKLQKIIDEASAEIGFAWQTLARVHLGEALGRPITAAEATERQRVQEEARRIRQRPSLIQQGLGFLQANLPPSASLEYRQHLQGIVEQAVDQYLDAVDQSRSLDVALPDFAQFMAPTVVRVPSERAFQNLQARGGPGAKPDQQKAAIERAAIQEGLRSGLLSSASPPEEIDAFLKELLPQATNFAALREQEAQATGQPFDFLEALGVGLQQAVQRRTQAQELERFTRIAGISGQKREAERQQREAPLGGEAELPFVLRNFLRTPLQGDERAQLEESFFREFLAEQPRETLSAFMRPQPGFEELSPGLQSLLEGVAQGKYPQFEEQGGPPAAAGGPLGAGAPVLPGPLGPAGFVPTQTPSQRAANQLFGFLNQGQQQGFQPFDLEGFLTTQRQRFRKERLPQIDLESFLPKSSAPQRVGRNIFLRGGL